MKTTFIIEDVFKIDLQNMLSSTFINDENLPEQFTSFKEAMEHTEKMDRRTPMLISTSVNDLVYLNLGDEVTLYGKKYKVISKSFNVDFLVMKYRIR